MRVETRIKLKLLTFDLTFELFVNSVILTIAYFSNKVLATLFFYLIWRALRFSVPKIFHCKAKTPFLSILGCAFFSVIIFWLAIRLMLPLCVSIFSGVIIGEIINISLYKIQDYIDLKKESGSNTIDIYKMSEDELRRYAISKGVSEMLVDTLVLRVIHNYRWVDIRNERNYSRRGMDYHRETLNKKLKIEL